MSTLKNPVQMAVIGAAHGIKGELRVKTFTGDPLALGDYGTLYAKDGRAFEIVNLRPQGEVVVVRFKGVSDRNAAEALTGTELFVDRSALPDDAEEDEFYHADLIGLAVRDETGANLGTVRTVQNYGGGDILVVAGLGGEALVPFTRAAVPHVDIAGGFLEIDKAAAGLLPGEDDAEARAATDDGGHRESRKGFDPSQRPRGPKDAGGNR
jgi:16S rRNA processing protein RimM